MALGLLGYGLDAALIGAILAWFYRQRAEARARQDGYDAGYRDGWDEAQLRYAPPEGLPVGKTAKGAGA